MLELRGDALWFRFPEVHAEASICIDFQRTLRIPDDGKTYPLPPGLGRFPIRHTDDHRDRVPGKWLERGGVMVPMYQSEALWLSFHPVATSGRPKAYPFAIKVSAGKVSAVTGETWQSGLQQGDYLVAPGQPWLDGFCVEKGKIRQFVAMPLGWGLSVEQQVTGKEEHGGLQIEVFPMKAEVYERLYPRREVKTSGLLRGYGCGSGQSAGGGSEEWCFSAADRTEGFASVTYSLNADMGLGAGGTMKQEIFQDVHGIEVWDIAHSSKLFVHLANSFAWQAITGAQPPASPATVEAYARHGMPWFDYYLDGMPIAEGGKNLKAIKSVLELGFQKGMNVLPSNESVTVPAEKVHTIPGARGTVRDGSW